MSVLCKKCLFNIEENVMFACFSAILYNFSNCHALESSRIFCSNAGRVGFDLRENLKAILKTKTKNIGKYQYFISSL